MSGLAVSTQRTYSCGQCRYLRFCEAAGTQALPVREDVLCKFIAQLSQDGLRHQTTKTYMAGIRLLQIDRGLGDAFLSSLCKLHYVFWGVKRTQAEDGGSSRKRLPITPSLLRSIKGIWDRNCADPDLIMLWAACCVAFFSFMRAGELTVPSDKGYDGAVHLSLSDISMTTRPVRGCCVSDLRPPRQTLSTRGSPCSLGSGLRYLPCHCYASLPDGRGQHAGPLFKF